MTTTKRPRGLLLVLLGIGAGLSLVACSTDNSGLGINDGGGGGDARGQGTGGVSPGSGGGPGTGGTAATGGVAGTGGRSGTGGATTGTGGALPGTGGATTGTGGAATGTGGVTTGTGGMMAGTGGASTGTGGTDLFCGGIAAFPCPANNQFCETAPGDCLRVVDASGLCVARPTACTRDLHPVCGCDGNTYSNDCTRRAAGVSKASDGACTGQTACTQDMDCRDRSFCELGVGQCATDGPRSGMCQQRPQACNAIAMPVCGCDNKTYGNDCERMSAGVAKLSDGACGAATCPAAAPVAGAACPEPGQACLYPTAAGPIVAPACRQRFVCGNDRRWGAAMLLCPAAI